MDVCKQTRGNQAALQSKAEQLRQKPSVRRPSTSGSVNFVGPIVHDHGVSYFSAII